MPNKCYCYIVAWVVSVAQQLSQLLLLLVLLLSLLYTFMMPVSRPLFSSSPFIRFSKNKSKSAKILLNFKQNKLLSVEKSSEREKERRQVKEKKERERERVKWSGGCASVVLCPKGDIKEIAAEWLRDQRGWEHRERERKNESVQRSWGWPRQKL